MDFIKKLIAGIVSFLTGLLPGKNKKSNGYFLELDEAKDTVKKAAETVVDNTKKVAETVTAAAPAAPKAESLNGTKAAAKKKSAKEAKPADVQLVQTAQGLKVEPGKNEKAAAAKVVKEEPKVTTFAPKYVAATSGSTNGRRLPGANMSSYLDLALQVKTSK